MGPRVILAPDKFKGTVDAATVAQALARGFRQHDPTPRTDCLPVADGGDGSIAAALASGFTGLAVNAAGPLGNPRRTTVAVKGSHVLLEMASICGLQQLPAGELAPARATSLGLGLAIRSALDRGATRLTVGLGGSASTDGGAGLLVGLGARLLDSAGRDLPADADLTNVDRVDLDPLDVRLARADIVFAVDVEAPLLGPVGAARAFGAQKGADVELIDRLEQAMEHWARLLATACGADPRIPGSGAAGGTGFVAQAIGARLVDGADAVLDLLAFDERVRGADLVVTGEGRLDAQTLMGKAPIAVAQRCHEQGIRCVAVVGSRDPAVSDAVLAEHGLHAVHEVVERASDTARDPEQTVRVLERIGATLAEELVDGSPCAPVEKPREEGVRR